MGQLVLPQDKRDILLNLLQSHHSLSDGVSNDIIEGKGQVSHRNLSLESAHIL